MAIHKHIDRYDILTPLQHVFRKGHSCETLLLLTVDNLMCQKVQADIAIFDFLHTFDTVPHERLLTKLDYYGMHGPILHWIRAFLCGR